MTYIDELADSIRSELPANARPAKHADELYRLYALLVRVSGQHTTLQNVHDAWSTWMSAHQPTHRSLRPFEHLDLSTQEEDRPYLEAILTVARRRREQA